MSDQLHIFHNTTRLLPSEKIEKEVKHLRQEDKVFKVFEEFPHGEFTNWDLYYRLGQQYPITSIRRSTSNLCRDEFIIDTDRKRKSGPYNEIGIIWKYNQNKTSYENQ